MKKYFVIAILIFISLQNPALSWDVIKTDHFTIFYKPEYEGQAKEFLALLEYYRPKVEQITGNRSMSVPIVIEDIGTVSNGMTDPVNKRIFLYKYPPSASSLGSSIESWESLVGVHEYTHLLHMTKTGGLAGAVKTVFGTYFMPNTYSLGWTIEGITVYTESQLSPYQGRLNDGYYSSYVSSRAKEGRFPSILEAAYQPIDYPLGDGIYNYGGVFFDYLAKTYGEDKFSAFFENYGSSLPIFMFGLSARQVYGKSFPKLWDEWKQYEIKKAADYEMEGEKLTDKGWYASDLVLYNGKLYYIRRYVEKTGTFDVHSFSKIVEKDTQTGIERSIISTTSTFLTPIKVHDGKLYYTVTEMKGGYANVTYMTYGAYSILHEKDLMTNKDKICLKDEIRDFEIMDNGDIIYSKDRADVFGSEIIRYDANTNEKQKLFDTDYLVDRITKNDDSLIVSARKDWANYSLYKLDLGQARFTTIADNPRFEGFQSVTDNKAFFTANYGGMHSTYCYDLKLDKTYRLTDNGYSSYPVYDADNNRLYYIGLSSYGYDIYAKDTEWNEYQIPDERHTTKPDYELDESLIRKGSYADNLRALVPNMRIPFFYYDMDAEEGRIGALLAGQDTLGHFPYTGQLWYDFYQKKPLYDFTVSANILAPFLASFSARNIDKDKELKFDMQYPLFRRMNAGLNDVYIGLSGDTYNESESDTFDRFELSPHLLTTFGFPKTAIGIGLDVPIERESMGSRVNRTALIGNININRYIRKSAFNMRIRGIYDPDTTYNPDIDDEGYSPFPVIRGYDSPLNAKIGASFSADLTAPLFPLRFGLFFTPYIFFQDVCASLFFDASVPDNGKYPQMSTGIELHLETNAAMYVPFDLGVRFVINKDKDFNIEPFINLGFSF